MSFTTHKLAAVAAIAAASLGLSGCAAGEAAPEAPAADQLETLVLDYANWNPLSLVIKNQGWLEDELADEGITVEWVFSESSAASNENLNAGATLIGSSAGAASFVARANGQDIQTVGVFSQPNWASIVVAEGSELDSVDDLAGKTVAAAIGTDPYFFLLQALDEAGIPASDVEIVNLAHADGQKALEAGDVDAWAGLDPLTANSEQTAGSHIIYSNPAFNSWGVLNTTSAFATDHADVLEVVLAAYQKARTWIGENPDQAVTILATNAGFSEDIARVVLLERTNVDVSIVPGAVQRAVLETIIPVLVEVGKVKTEEAARSALETLYVDSVAKLVE